MKVIRSFTPQSEENLPLELRVGDGGTVGLRFNPVYNAQWKETGEWQQAYYAYPNEGWHFEGWFDIDRKLISKDAAWIDTYGESRQLTARFGRN